jgi:hypothetical protein
MTKFSILSLIMLFIMIGFLPLTKNIRKDNVIQYKKSLRNDCEFKKKETGLRVFFMSMVFITPKVRYFENEPKDRNYGTENNIKLKSITFFILLVFTLFGSIANWFVDEIEETHINMLLLLIIDIFIFFVVYFGFFQFGIVGMILSCVYFVALFFGKFENGFPSFEQSLFMIGPSVVKWTIKLIEYDNKINEWKREYKKKLNINYN